MTFAVEEKRGTDSESNIIFAEFNVFPVSLVITGIAYGSCIVHFMQEECQ
jgi:hypothetical protein